MPRSVYINPQFDYDPSRGTAGNNYGDMGAGLQGVAHGLLQGSSLKRQWEMEDKEAKLKQKLDEQKQQHDLVRTQIEMMNYLMNQQKMQHEQTKLGWEQKKYGREEEKYQNTKTANTAMGRVLAQYLGLPPEQMDEISAGGGTDKFIGSIGKVQDIKQKSEKYPLDLQLLKSNVIANKFKARKAEVEAENAQGTIDAKNEATQALTDQRKAAKAKLDTQTQKIATDMKGTTKGSNKAYEIALKEFNKIDEGILVNDDWDPEDILKAKQKIADNAGMETEPRYDEDGEVYDMVLVPPGGGKTTTTSIAPQNYNPQAATEVPDGFMRRNKQTGEVEIKIGGKWQKQPQL